MKVLITSVRTGSGHVKAAEALLAAFQKVSPSVHVVHIDVIDWVKSGFRRIYLDGYRIAVNRAPSLWGGLYRFSDRKPSGMNSLSLVNRAQRRSAGVFFEHLRGFQPDLILTTHFLVPQLLAGEEDHPPVECVITDYQVHQFWVSDAVSRYYVAHEGMISDLERRGVPASRVTVSGVPVHPCFSDLASPSSLFQKLGLDPLKPVLLVLAGGSGLNRLEEAVKNLLSLPKTVQIITVSGRNEVLKKQLGELKVPFNVKLVNLGYVNNMHELLSLSDIVITKPGGLTISECMAKKKPMVLISPIPGQEEKNAGYLISRGAALKASSLEELPAVATRLLTDRSLQERIKSNLEACARPNAAASIVRAVASSFSMAA